MGIRILIFIFVLVCPQTFAQSIKILRPSVDSDSSFYHLAKISDNEYWAGGEYGILKKIDSTGALSSLNFGITGQSILKIQRVKEYVYICTDKGTIFRYSLNTGKIISKQFKGFENRCFYDLAPLQDGKILVCGGTSGISTGEKKIPHGFIAIVNSDLDSIQVVWRNYRKFVWSMTLDESGNWMAACFNGLNTKVICSGDLIHWKKKFKIKGLVHELVYLDKKIYFCGTKSIKYTKTGILGVIENKEKQTIETSKGCYWSLDKYTNYLLAVCQNGKISRFNIADGKISEISLPNALCLYDFERINDGKYLVVGHGGGAYIVNIR